MTQTPASEEPDPTMELLRLGAQGDAVAEVRSMLATIGLLDNTDPSTAAVFDAATELAVRHFQQRRGISVDGQVGAETYVALTGAHWRLGDRPLYHDAGNMLTGDDVTELQNKLLELGYNISRADGFFGRRTAEGLRGFQREYGLVPDGLCGPNTLRAFRQLEGRRVVGGRPLFLREMVAVAVAGPSLLGKRIVIDPGHGGTDSGVIYEDTTEAELVWDLANRLEGRLKALGVQTGLTRGPRNTRTDEERAQFANEVGADLVISLHVDGFSSPRPNGLAVYYYGGVEATSTMGERLADLVQRELVARTAAVRQPDPRQGLDAAAAHPHAGRPRRARLPHLADRPAAAARPTVSRHRRRGAAGGRPAAVPATSRRSTDRGHADLRGLISALVTAQGASHRAADQSPSPPRPSTPATF